jgi:hypothetical protein
VSLLYYIFYQKSTFWHYGVRLYYTSRLASLADTSARRNNQTDKKNRQIKPREKAVHAEPLLDRLFSRGGITLFQNLSFVVRIVDCKTGISRL